MYHNILLPIAFDGDTDFSRPLEIARALRAEGGKIKLLHVFDTPPAYALQYIPDDLVRATREGVLADMEAAVANIDDVECEILDGPPGRTIANQVEEAGYDLVVLASHRPGMGDIVWGSTAAFVVRHVACSVHVLRPR